MTDNEIVTSMKDLLEKVERLNASWVEVLAKVGDTKRDSDLKEESEGTSSNVTK